MTTGTRGRWRSGREWDSLRIEGGYPAFGYEITGDLDKAADAVSSDGDKNDSISEAIGAGIVGVKAGPLELHLDATIDESKGCYLGQESVAAILKNRGKGPPRTLYSVVFHDDDNAYEHLQGRTLGDDDHADHEKDDNNDIMDFADLLRAAAQAKGQGSSPEENPASPTTPPAAGDDVTSSASSSTTRLPVPGDALYVLGSSSQIRVGTITSMAENGATGQPTTVGLALVRRPGTILKKMDELGLELGGGVGGTNIEDDPLWRDADSGKESLLGRAGDDNVKNDGGGDSSGGGGMIAPPPPDPLDGLEVIVGGTNTFGTLRSLPERRYKMGRNMFDEEVAASSRDYEEEEQRGGSIMGTIPQQPKQQALPVQEEGVKDAGIPSGWESSVVVEDYSGSSDNDDDEERLRRAAKEAEMAAAEAEAAAAEAKRKAEKMLLLKQRAEEAMAKRRQKKKKKKKKKMEQQLQKRKSDDQ